MTELNGVKGRASWTVGSLFREALRSALGWSISSFITLSLARSICTATQHAHQGTSLATSPAQRPSGSHIVEVAKDIIEAIRIDMMRLPKFSRIMSLRMPRPHHMASALHAKVRASFIFRDNANLHLPIHLLTVERKIYSFIGFARSCQSVLYQDGILIAIEES